MVSLRLAEIGREPWTEFLEGHSSGSLFHTWAWQDVLEAGFGVRVNRLGIFDGAELCGILPLAERQMSLLTLAGAPLSGTATPYGGPLGVEIAPVLPALESYAAQRRIDYLEIGLDSADQRVCARLEQAGYTTEILKTLTLPLPADEAALWAGLEVRCRNAVRKAQKSGVRITQAERLEDWLEPYYELSCGVYRRQDKQPPFTREYFRQLWLNFHAGGDLTVLLAHYEDRMVAGAIFPRERRVAYYLDGVSDREYNKVVPNNLIQWEFLQRALNDGITLYDMVGANIPSIAKFKQSFGSTESAYLYAYRNRTLQAKLGRALYARYGGKLKKILRQGGGE
jgi:hypothetical protein